MGVRKVLSRPATGFTLIEVIVVLVLMVLAAGLALPFLHSGLEILQSSASGRGVVSFLNDARLRAVNTSSTVEVLYDFEGRAFSQRIRKETKARYDLPAGVRVTGLEAGGQTVDRGTATVTFYPLGDSSGGTIFLEGSRGRKFKVSVGVLFASPYLTKVTE